MQNSGYSASWDSAGGHGGYQEKAADLGVLVENQEYNQAQACWGEIYYRSKQPFRTIVEKYRRRYANRNQETGAASSSGGWHR